MARFEVSSAGDAGETGAAEVTGLRPGQAHGSHGHELGDLTAPDATSAGGHHTPEQRPHGGLDDQAEKHAGDLGSLQVDRRASPAWSWSPPGASLTGERPVLGRALIVHAQAGRLRRQPSGDAGAGIGADCSGSPGLDRAAAWSLRPLAAPARNPPGDHGSRVARQSAPQALGAAPARRPAACLTASVESMPRRGGEGATRERRP